MYDRAIDKILDGVSGALVELYLYAPKLTSFVLLAFWLLLFWIIFWYFVLLPAGSNLVINGSFETRLVGWGTGWLEDFPAYRAASRVDHYLLHHNQQEGRMASAQWRSDPGEHLASGRFALLIEHSSEKFREVYSTLAQRIRVKERTTYNVSFWAKVDHMKGDGELWLSPNGSSVAWDQPKLPVFGAGQGWKPYSLDFNSGDRVDLDIRFVAEGPMRVWVDDLVVRRVPSGDTAQEVLRSRVQAAWAWATKWR